MVSAAPNGAKPNAMTPIKRRARRVIEMVRRASPRQPGSAPPATTKSWRAGGRWRGGGGTPEVELHRRRLLRASLGAKERSRLKSEHLVQHVGRKLFQSRV